MKLSTLLLFLLLANISANCQTFGVDGKVTTDISGNDYAYAMTIQMDGKVILAGTTGLSESSFALTRYNLDGTLDNTFGGDGIVVINTGGNAIARSIAVQSDGRIVVAGSTSVGFSSNFTVIRINSDGSLDKSFDHDGIVITEIYEGFSSASALALQNDGKIVVAGSVGYYKSGSFAIARYNTDGSIDSTFDNDGIALVEAGLNGNINAIALQSDGKIVAAGYRHVDYFSTQSALLRFNTNGSLDNTFGDNGIITKRLAPQNEFYTVAIQTDGKILAGGFSESPIGRNLVLARYNENGTPDNSFDGDGEIRTNQIFGNISIRAIALLNNKIVAVKDNFNILIFNNDGSPDSAFNGDGTAVVNFNNKSGISTSIKIYNNNIYIAGYINNGTNVTANNDFALGVIPIENSSNITITCPAPVTVNTEKGLCNAVVNNIEPGLIGSVADIRYNLTGATAAIGSGNASGQRFNKGITTVHYFSQSDPSKSCSFTVTVRDLEAPVITGLKPGITTIWPPNHKMTPVDLYYTSRDNCNVSSCSISISSNEPTAGTPDWIINNDHKISLRAERNGNGNGRIYTIKVVCKDAEGNPSNAAFTTVTVPKSMGKNKKDNTALKNVFDELNEEKTKTSFNVMATPNPTTSGLKISIQNQASQQLQKADILVYDIYHRVVERKDKVATNQTIVMGSNLLPGIYFVEVIQGNQRKTIKVLKQ